MSGKRQATSDLNHTNWDRDEEPEERGTFKTATDDELKGRVIKKAARRKLATGTVDAADGSSATKSVFSGFSGFGKPPAATQAAAAASPFSFLSKIPSAAGAGIVSSSTAATTSATATFSFGSATTTAKAAGTDDATKTTDSKPSFSFGSAVSSAATKTTAATAPAPTTFSFGSTSAKESKGDTDSTDAKSSEYYAKLKGLNQSVSEWIKTHVDRNPLCILTPIFKDYEKYLTELEDEKAKADKSTTSTAVDKKLSTTTASAGSVSYKFSETTSSTAKTSAPSVSTFSFSSSAATSTPSTVTDSAPKTNGFSFGLKKQDETKESTNKPASTPATSGFSFGLKTNTDTSTTPSTSSSTAPSTGFTFGKPASTSDDGSAPKPFSFTPGGTPFSFGNIKPPAAPTTTEHDDEDEEPPKNEFKQVVEDDAVYSKKCKVFVKKDGNFADKGVGTLYLKPIESSGKTQLIVRADTNLGNILVNLILSSAIPSQRMGKNNVMMVCVPSPDVEKPTPMLLRVKTGEEADELLENIEKYKK